MDLILQTKIDELLNIISNDIRIKELKELKSKLMNNQILLEKIKNAQSSQYLDKNLKEELYQNKDYQQYQHLENEIYFLTLEMNKIINRLTDKKGCNL